MSSQKQNEARKIIIFSGVLLALITGFTNPQYTLVILYVTLPLIIILTTHLGEKGIIGFISSPIIINFDLFWGYVIGIVTIASICYDFQNRMEKLELENRKLERILRKNNIIKY